MTDGEVDQLRKNQRDYVLERAKGLPFLDAVFVLIHYNESFRRMGPLPHDEPINVRAQFSHRHPQEIEEAVRRVQSLHGAAYGIGDALLGHDPAYQQKERQFRDTHPGFSDESYNAIISYGCFLAR
jgi:hypothetical protein